MTFSRRKFLAIGAAAIGVFGTFRMWISPKAKQAKTYKFLTHDGKLVEVDLKNISRKKSKASKQQLVSWVWKNQKL